jgi:hypothetical protein
VSTQPPNPIIFLDMDGVLVDFIGGACELHGKANPYTQDYAQGHWGVEALLDIDPVDFWKPLGRDFWANLKWLPDGKRILMVAEAVSDLADNVCLLSTPCDTFGCADGKRDWVKREMPSYAGRLFLGKKKAALSRPRAVLVDDSDENCREWSERGGTAILVPRPWNSQHTRAAWSARHVAACLSAFSINERGEWPCTRAA